MTKEEAIQILAKLVSDKVKDFGTYKDFAIDMAIDYVLQRAGAELRKVIETIPKCFFFVAVRNRILDNIPETDYVFVI